MNSAAFVNFAPPPMLRGVGFAAAGVAVGGIFLWAYWSRKRVRPVRTGDRQGDVYAAIRIAVSWRKRKRDFEFRALDPQASARSLTYDPYRPPKWRKLEAGLQASGSEAVRTAAQAASAANLAAMEALAGWTRAKSEMSRKAALHARNTADEADRSLVRHIRAEMQAKGLAFADWVPGPAGDGVET